MNANLVSVIATPPSGRTTALLMDHHDYAHAVFLRNKAVPWGDPTAYARFFNQAQGLLAPDLAIFDLGHFYEDQLSQMPELETAMAAKKRTGYALRTMLGDKDLAGKATELAQTLISMASGAVVLQIPSPMQWLCATHHFSGSTQVEDLDADDAENSSVYVADWMRALAALPFAAVLLDDRPLPGKQPSETVDLSTYTPITNVTAHYRLIAGMRREDAVSINETELRGAVIPDEFWTGTAPLPSPADFHVTHIPETAIPETVLDQLEKLK